MESHHKKVLKALSLELRHLLEGEYDADGRWHAGDLEQRLAALGVWRDRPPLPADEMTHLSPTDREARDVVDAYLVLRREGDIPRAEAVGEFVRETAYTWANRLLALRCMEARELIDEVILQKAVYGGRSLQHHRLARRRPELCLGEDDGLYAVLDRAFQQQAERLPLLFDPKAPGVALKPSAAALKRCVTLLSGTEAVKGKESATDKVFQAPDALGWAYQYWNTEEKDRVFEKVRTQKGAKIQGADIIPATQLYTEPYMVKFLVQNSLGATWTGMHPESRLADGWEYYVRDADRAPAEKKPVREITLLDPACGSGHFLLEAFDLFYDMYLEEGELTDPHAICASIIQHNLYGIDIDERAVQIAEAALWMKAAERAFDYHGAPSNLVATNIRLPKGVDHLKAFLAKYPEEKDLRPALEVIFEGLEHADELGSLLQIEEPVEKELRYLQAKYATTIRRGVQTDMFRPTAVQGELPLGVESYEEWKAQILTRLKEHFAAEGQAVDYAQSFFGRSAGKGLMLFDLLARRYDVLTTNPPYMGSRNMPAVLKSYVSTHYAPGKRDLYSAFMLRCMNLAQDGFFALVTMHTWQALSSFEKLRVLLLEGARITLIANLARYAYSEADPPSFVVLFVGQAQAPTKEQHIIGIRQKQANPAAVQAANLRSAVSYDSQFGVDMVKQMTVRRLPGSPLIYWLPETLIAQLEAGENLARHASIHSGMQTGNNDRLTRFVWECTDLLRWKRYAKGGGYRKWRGFENVRADWRHDGVMFRICPSARLLGTDLIFRRGLTYSYVCRGSLGVRLLSDSAFDNSSMFIHPKRSDVRYRLAAALNCRAVSYLMRAVSDGIKFQPGQMGIAPVNRMSVENPLLEMGARVCEVLSLAELSTTPTEDSMPLDKSSPRDFQEKLLVINTLRHTIEGSLENAVFSELELNNSDVQAICAETDVPVGWLPAIQRYDLFPTFPVDIPDQWYEVVTASMQYECLEMLLEQVGAMKHRLRTIYEAGPGAELGDGSQYSLIHTNCRDSDGTDETARIPIPTETFLEEIAQQLRIHPISVYWLLKEGIEQEGWRCLPEEQRIIADRFTVMILRLLGHRWPKQIEAGEPIPNWADDDGVIPLTEATDEPTLLDRVRERIAEEFPGGDATSIEGEFAEIMGKSLERWLATEFFSHHTRQFKKRPIAWQIQSGRFTARKKPAFACLVYYHKLGGAVLTTIQSQYVRPLRQRYETELRGIESIPATARSGRQDARRVELEGAIEELRAFDATLSQVAAEGFASDVLREIVEKEPLDRWCSVDGVKPHPKDRVALLRQEGSYIPDLNDGVRVNIAPLQKAGLLAANVLSKKDLDKSISDRAEWRADERRWCREGKLPRPGWWPAEQVKGE